MGFSEFPLPAAGGGGLNTYQGSGGGTETFTTETASGANAGGYIYADASSTGIIEGAVGSQAFGTIVSTGSGGTDKIYATGYIKGGAYYPFGTYGGASFAFGGIHNTRAGNCEITAWYGSMAFGQVYVPSGVTSGTTKIAANNAGSFSHGYVKSTISSDSQARISSSSQGATSWGHLEEGGSAGGNVFIEAGKGATAFGSLSAASTSGSTTVAINASGRGSLAGGYLKQSGASSLRIQATGKGAFAFGYATSAYITASATNAVQFGQGTNSQADSLGVGTTVRLKGTTGAPSSPRDGDIWVASNYVYIRSNGVSVKIT